MASLICLILILKADGADKNLKLISFESQNELFQLRGECEELAQVLDYIMKFKQ